MSPPSPDLTGPGADALVSKAYELTASGATPAGWQELLSASGESRSDLEAARDLVAARVHARVDDFEATAALQLLNRAVSRAPIHDPLDWKVRWGQRFRRP